MKKQLDQNSTKRMLTIEVKKLSGDAKLPIKEPRDIPDAGWDLYSNETIRIAGLGKAAVGTGIAIAIPDGWFGNIRNRSGNAIKTPIMVDAGIIDPGYRGEIKIVLVNHSEFPYDILKGDKIAQMLIEKIVVAEFKEVKELSATDRGDKGFGSTGS